MTLDELYGLVGAHRGSTLNLPDFGVTEGLQKILQPGNNSNPNNGSNLFTNPQDYLQASHRLATTGAPAYPSVSVPVGGRTNAAGQVLGTNTTNILPPTNNGTGAGAGTGNNRNPNDGTLAKTAYDLAQERIQNLFNQQRDLGQQQADNATNRFSDIMKAVDAFKARALQQNTDSGQQITNTASNITNQNATNAQGLVGKAVGQARSLGLGLSSRINLGQGLLKNLESTQGNVAATQGEQIRANDLLLGQRNDTGDQQAAAALTDKNNALAGVDAFNRANLASYGTNEQAAGQDFAGMLNNIINYNRSLQAMSTPNTSSLTPYSPNFINGLNQSISSVLPSTGGTPTSTANTPNTLANPTTLVDLLNKKPNPYGVYGQ